MRLVFFFPLLLAVGPLRGATWVLLNGDRFTGTLVTQTAKTVTIAHPTLGRLTIPRNTLAATSTGSTSGKSTDAGVRGEGPHWKRMLEFGFVSAAGVNPQENLSLRAQIEGRDEADTYRVTGRINRSEARGVVASDERSVAVRWRRELSPRVFAQSETTWSAAPVRQLEQAFEQQVGGGLRLDVGRGRTANVGVGIALRTQDRAALGSETSVLGSVFQDFARSLPGGFKFSEEASVAYSGDRPYRTAPTVVGTAPPPADGGNYRLRFNTLFQGKLTDEITFNLRYDLDYDRSVPDPASRLDRRLTTSLGYTW